MVALCALVAVVVAVLVTSLASSYQRTCRISPFQVDFGPLPTGGVWAPEFNTQELERFAVGCDRPEDVAFDKHGRAYTGCADGWVKRVNEDGKLENFTHTGGRPLGLAIRGDPELIYVADTTLGLVKIAISDRVSHIVADKDDQGVPILFADGVTIARDGTVYFTDASNKFRLEENALDILEARPNGRLLKYDPSTSTTTVVQSNLWFANGVALSENDDFLVMTETTRVRLLRIWLQGERKGTVEVFVSGLPGMPDNVRRGDDGNFYVAVVGQRTPLLDWIYSSSTGAKLRCIATQQSLVDLTSSSRANARVVVFNKEGEFVKKYEDPTGKLINFVTGGNKHGDYVYMTTLNADFIGRIKVT